MESSRERKILPRGVQSVTFDPIPQIRPYLPQITGEGSPEGGLKVPRGVSSEGSSLLP